jgi:hypothetical protein
LSLIRFGVSGGGSVDDGGAEFLRSIPVDVATGATTVIHDARKITAGSEIVLRINFRLQRL